MKLTVSGVFDRDTGPSWKPELSFASKEIDIPWCTIQS